MLGRGIVVLPVTKSNVFIDNEGGALPLLECIELLSLEIDESILLTGDAKDYQEKCENPYRTALLILKPYFSTKSGQLCGLEADTSIQ